VVQLSGFGELGRDSPLPRDPETDIDVAVFVTSATVDFSSPPSPFVAVRMVSRTPPSELQTMKPGA